MVLIAVVAVLLLRGDDDPTTRSAARRTRASTTTTSSTTTTTAPTTTTSAPPDTSVVPKSTNPIVALAQQYEGRYVGTFTNTTFNTTGPVALELRIDPATGDMNVKAHFEGDLFGGGAKPPNDIESIVTLGGDPNAAVTTNTKGFGPVTGHVDATLALVLNAPDVPGSKVKSFDLTGHIKADYSGFDATYNVGFEDGSTAQGTVTITCATDGQRSVEGVPTLCSPG